MAASAQNCCCGLPLAAAGGDRHYLAARLFRRLVIHPHPPSPEVLKPSGRFPPAANCGNTAISSWRALLGFAIGGSIGLVLGLISGLSRWGERLLDTSIQMLRNVPHLALIPLVGSALMKAPKSSSSRWDHVPNLHQHWHGTAISIADWWKWHVAMACPASPCSAM